MFSYLKSPDIDLCGLLDLIMPDPAIFRVQLGHRMGSIIFRVRDYNLNMLLHLPSWAG